MIPKREVGSQKSGLCPPPPVPISRSPAPFPPLFLGGVILLIVAVHFAVQWHFPMPVCGLRKFTGIPCPFCGSTRSLLAWSHFEIVEALRFNPLIFLALLAVAAWFFVWSSDRFFKRQWSTSILCRFQSKPVRFGLYALVFLNWIYLCLTLPQ